MSQHQNPNPLRASEEGAKLLCGFLVVWAIALRHVLRILAVS